MALSKKKSRPISVDGKDYRWVFFENSGWNDITIQSASGRGQKLVIQQNWSHKGTPYINLEAPITPSIVRQMIESALQHSWTPEKSGPELRLKWDGSGVQPIPRT